MLPPAQVTPGLCPEHIPALPCPALALLCCWQGTNPQLWVQGLEQTHSSGCEVWNKPPALGARFLLAPGKQRKQLQMQVPVQMGGKQRLRVLSQQLSAAHKIMISGQCWWTFGDSGLFCARLGARAEPGGSVRRGRHPT